MARQERKERYRSSRSVLQCIYAMSGFKSCPQLGSYQDGGCPREGDVKGNECLTECEKTCYEN